MVVLFSQFYYQTYVLRFKTSKKKDNNNAVNGKPEVRHLDDVDATNGEAVKNGRNVISSGQDVRSRKS